MTRLIDADSVYKWYLEAFKGLIKPNEIRFSINDIRDNLENIPTIDAEPVRHGKWIEKSTGWEHFACCSECGHVEWDTPTNYCPNCGADMRGKDSKPPQVNPEMVKALLDRIEKQRGEE